jgi:ribonuclease D
MLSQNLFCWVCTQAELEHVAHELNAAKELAVDTETDNLHAFHARLCLIQIATDKNIFLVDGLSKKLDFQILAPAFENLHITKYFHSASSDLSFLLTKKLRVLGLFDTQRAALYLQKPKLGLAWLTQDYLGISLDKAQQRANFARRPLPDKVLSYAASDVRFLLQLGRLLKAECLQKNLLEEVLLDCLRLETEAQKPIEPGEGFVFRQAAHLSAAQQHISKNIAHRLHTARLKWAQAKNKPFGQILSNHSLQAIAHAAPTSPEALQKLPGVQKNFVTQFGACVLQHIEAAKQTAFNASADSTFPSKELERLLRKRTEALHKFRAQELSSHPLSPSQILTNTLIERLAECPPTTPEELLRFPYFGNKRFRQYGSRLLALLNRFE